MPINKLKKTAAFAIFSITLYYAFYLSKLEGIYYSDEIVGSLFGEGYVIVQRNTLYVVSVSGTAVKYGMISRGSEQDDKDPLTYFFKKRLFALWLYNSENPSEEYKLVKSLNPLKSTEFDLIDFEEFRPR